MINKTRALDNKTGTNWTPLAIGLGACFFWLGLGSCCMLLDKSQDAPLIHVEVYNDAPKASGNRKGEQ